MEIERQVIQSNDFEVPCAAIIPTKVKGAAVVVHGYGGSKEEQLGLAWRIAETGVAAYAIDLRGHGEHRLPLNSGVPLDVEAVIKHCRKFGKVAAIGHSLGGRLVLASSADFGIGISPALDIKYSAKTEEVLRNLRKHKVRYETKEEFLEIMTQIPVWKPCLSRPTLVIYGSRDISEIISLCCKLQTETTVVWVEGALHNDSYLHQVTFAEITKYLQQWL